MAKGTLRPSDAIDPNYVRAVLSYCPETGELRWREKVAQRVNVGDIAGFIGSNGSRIIKLKGEAYQGSRVAWMHYYGEVPAGNVKRRNGDLLDISIKNLILEDEFYKEKHHNRLVADGDENSISADRLRWLLDYDPEAGIFTTRHAGSRGPAGRVLGGKVTTRGKTYTSINIDGRFYKAHRLAWLHVHGEWPNGMLDHIDGDGENNRLDNLRPADSSLNAWNRLPNREATKSGLIGVSPITNSQRFQAHIDLDKKRVYLGSFDTAEEASTAYWAAKRDMHPGATAGSPSD